MRKEIKMHWHSHFLITEKWDVSPRSFNWIWEQRVQKKWAAILNKCSSELILLIIEETGKEKESLKLEITDVKRKIVDSNEDQLKLSQEGKL